MSEIDDQDEARTELVGGVIEHEYWGWYRGRCVITCRQYDDPRPSRTRFACPWCHGKAIVEANTEPEPSRLGVWIGGWMRVWRDVLATFRWREPDSRVPMPCPVCEAAEWREAMQVLISECGQHDGQEADSGAI